MTSLQRKTEKMNDNEKILAIIKKRLSSVTHIQELSASEVLNKEFRNLLDLLKRTCEFGESNSVLIVGPRGAGKTSFLESVLAELKKDENVSSNMIEIHLNGLLQTDDRITLKEITTQLNLKSENKVFRSFQENLLYLLDTLKQGSPNSKSVIFILDEFDLFCYHKNQTLLYNLFDICQSVQTPIAVVGITCRLDVTELLEKRVKSRYSHRQIHIFPKFSFEEYINMARNMFSVTDDSIKKKSVQTWNHGIKEMFQNKTAESVLRQLYNKTKSVYSLKMLLFSALNANSHPTPGSLFDGYRSLYLDSKTVMLAGLSVLELTLIIAMNHLVQKYDNEPFNFQMVYNELSKFVNKHSSLQQFDQAVVMKAFEHLLELEFVNPVTSAIKSQKEYQMVELLIDSQQISETLQCYPNLPSEIHEWASSDIL